MKNYTKYNFLQHFPRLDIIFGKLTKDGLRKSFTKSPYNFRKVKKARKIAKESRKINRRK